MKFQYVFEKSNSWAISVELAKDINQLDARSHHHAKFELVQNLRKISLEISTDLAEAATHFHATSRKNINISISRKLTRLISQLFVAKELSYISYEEFQDLKVKVDSLSNYIHSLSKKEQLNHV